MRGKLAEWDSKHAAAVAKGAPEPASFVSELLPLLPLGPALDLACGTGHHTLLLADRGQAVTAVDGSSVALEILEQRARTTGHLAKRVLSDSGRLQISRHGIKLMQVDLDLATLPIGAFSLILCVHYLQRSLFAQIEDALVPGGMLLFETFTRAQLEFEGGPKNSHFLLERGELRTAFPALRVLFYRELCAGKGIASVIAQKPFNGTGEE
jgi:tellurite methyltransferase